MMRSLTAAVSGMRNHQVRMDVIGNNIANVNTVAFKASRVTFQERLSQSLSGPTKGSTNRGGVNGMEVGLGMGIGTIDRLFTQGFVENTGVNTDLAIQGDGFFVVKSSTGEPMYTRAGNFQVDAQGRLVQGGSGDIVQGVLADATGALPPNGLIQDLVISEGLKTPATASENVSISGNLDARAVDGDTKDVAITVYDSLGTPTIVTITFTKNGANTWDWSASDPANPAKPADPGDPTATPPVPPSPAVPAGVSGTGTATFNTDGTLATFTGGIAFSPTTGAAPLAITIDAAGASAFAGLTQYSAESTAFGRASDGNGVGELTGFNIDQSGVISGSFSNGETRAIGRIAIARFINPGGLESNSGGTFRQSVNSGEPQILAAGVANDISIASGALEGSNVDLTEEFTNMITTQRGFQANARVITTSDDMLNEVANLKR